MMWFITARVTYVSSLNSVLPLALSLMLPVTLPLLFFSLPPVHPLCFPLYALPSLSASAAVTVDRVDRPRHVHLQEHQKIIQAAKKHPLKRPRRQRREPRRGRGKPLLFISDQATFESSLTFPPQASTPGNLRIRPDIHINYGNNDVWDWFLLVVWEGLSDVCTQ